MRCNCAITVREVAMRKRGAAQRVTCRDRRPGRAMGTRDEIWEGEVSAHGYRAGDLKERALLVTRWCPKSGWWGGRVGIGCSCYQYSYIAGSGGKETGTYKAIVLEFSGSRSGFCRACRENGRQWVHSQTSDRNPKLRERSWEKYPSLMRKVGSAFK